MLTQSETRYVLKDVRDAAANREVIVRSRGEMLHLRVDREIRKVTTPGTAPRQRAK